MGDRMKPGKVEQWTIDSTKNEAAQWRHHALKNYSKEINMGLEPTNPKETIWVCLKMGYTPNYSHLVGIMIINHGV